MALIVEYHVVADMYPIGDTAISAGMLLTLQNGSVIPAPTATDPDSVCVGIAGDSALAGQGLTTAYSAALRTGSFGAGTRWTSNRVSDFYNEALASNKMTVYHGGGKFWVSADLFEDSDAIAGGDLLQISTTVAGEWRDAATDDDICALAVGAAQIYPSGVPGTGDDATASDAQFGANSMGLSGDTAFSVGEYIPLVLRL